MRARLPFRRSLLVLSLTLVAVVGLPGPVAADTPPQTELDHIVAIAKDHLGDRWVFAANGPHTFDCSGFVAFVFREAGLLDRIGGKRRTVAAFYKWFNDQGLADKTVGKPGDLIVWGNNKHIGIYLGDGMAISALFNPYGVKVHPVNTWIHMKVKAYLHVDLQR